MKATRINNGSVRIEASGIRVLVNPTEVEAADVLIITDVHPTHYSMDALTGILAASEGSVDILCSESVYTLICEKVGERHNPVLLAPHSVWSRAGVTFYSVKAQNPDQSAIGIILDDGEVTCYFSGATLYNFDVIDDVLDLVENGVDHAFLPISGRSNNMNPKDAADFAYEIGAKAATPICYAPGADISEFDFDDAVILEPGESTNVG